MKSLKANLPIDIYKGLIRKNAKLPEFYGLPKTHKPGIPIRPVVAAFDGPLSGVSIVLERILNHLFLQLNHSSTPFISFFFNDMTYTPGTIINKYTLTKQLAETFKVTFQLRFAAFFR